MTGDVTAADDSFQKLDADWSSQRECAGVERSVHGTPTPVDQDGTPTSDSWGISDEFS